MTTDTNASAPDAQARPEVRRNAAGEPVTEAGLNAWKQLQAGRLLVMERMPYLDAGITLLAPVEQPGLRTVACTETAIFLFDPEYIVTSTVESVAADLVHEVSHILRSTHARTRALGCCTPDQMKMSNIGADIAINDDIEAAGLPIVSAYGGIGSGNFGFAQQLLHEEYYVALMAIADKVPKPDKPKCGRGWCGSGGGMPVDNEPQQESSAANDPRNGNYGFAGRTPAEIELARQTVAHEIMKAQASRGNVPQGWQRWASEQLAPPVVPWEQHVRRITRHMIQFVAGKTDATYTRRSRRQARAGLGAPILPGYRKPVVPVVFMLDTSGSMATEDFDRAGAELVGVARAAGGDVLFASVDAEVHKMQRVRSWSEARQLIYGGGGTEFTGFFQYLETIPKASRPRVAIIATDGDAGVPDAPPKDLEVIWLITRRGGRAPASWGKALLLADVFAESSVAPNDP